MPPGLEVVPPPSASGSTLASLAPAGNDRTETARRSALEEAEEEKTDELADLEKLTSYKTVADYTISGKNKIN